MPAGLFDLFRTQEGFEIAFMSSNSRFTAAINTAAESCLRTARALSVVIPTLGRIGHASCSFVQPPPALPAPALHIGYLYCAHFVVLSLIHLRTDSAHARKLLCSSNAIVDFQKVRRQTVVWHVLHFGYPFISASSMVEEATLVHRSRH